MLRRTRVMGLLAVLALGIFALLGNRLVAPAPAHGAAGVVSIGAAKILTTSSGKTLYIFTVDKPGSKTSACTGKCLTFWPPALVSAGTTVPATMAGVPGKFGTITLKDGTSQLTYAGWPLYTFVKDKDSGDAYGQGVANVWWAVVVSRG